MCAHEMKRFPLVNAFYAMCFNRASQMEIKLYYTLVSKMQHIGVMMEYCMHGAISAVTITFQKTCWKKAKKEK